jgi:hypothetical protein
VRNGFAVFITGSARLGSSTKDAGASTVPNSLGVRGLAAGRSRCEEVCDLWRVGGMNRVPDPIVKPLPLIRVTVVSGRGIVKPSLA